MKIPHFPHLNTTPKIVGISIVAGALVISTVLVFGHDAPHLESKNVSVTNHHDSRKVNATTQDASSAEPTASDSVNITPSQPKPNSASSPSAKTAPAQNTPATQTTTPTTPTPAPTPGFTVTLHPERAVIHTSTLFPEYSYYDIPYTIVTDPGLRGTSSSHVCTLLDTPLLDSHIWCNVGQKGSIVSIQYDNVAVPGHYKMQADFMIGDVTHTVTSEFDL